MPGKTELQKNQEMIVVLDFGSQYNQLITRRIREFGVYSELHPHTITAEEIEKMNPTGIIFSGARTVFMMQMHLVVMNAYSKWVFRFSVFVMACSL